MPAHPSRAALRQAASAGPRAKLIPLLNSGIQVLTMSRPSASSRVARSIRLPRGLWRVLDEAALQAASASGRYVSANALLEAIVEAHFASRSVGVRKPVDLQPMRVAREAKRTQDRERVSRQESIVQALQRASSRAQRDGLNRAMATVDRWRRDRATSPQYIDAWSELLSTGLPAVVNALRHGHAGLSPTALASNSPFLARAQVRS